MRKLLVVAFVVGLGLGLLVVARAGVNMWLDWVNEPLAQPPNLHLGSVGRPPVVGAQAGQTPVPTAVPPTLVVAAPPRPTSTSTSVPHAEPSTPQRAAAPLSTPTVATPRSAPPPLTSVASTVVPLAGQQRRVTNTDGQGVALRAGPGADRLPGKGYDEGAVVTVLEQQGEWTHIRGNDGRDGWVLTVTLAP